MSDADRSAAAFFRILCFSIVGWSPDFIGFLPLLLGITVRGVGVTLFGDGEAGGVITGLRGGGWGGVGG